MKQQLVLLFFLILANNIFAQEYAEFSADTTRFRRWYAKNQGKLPDNIAEQIWFINGQKMKYGSGVIKIKANPGKLDTIIYRGYRRKEYDTIICNISKPKKYRFYYNDCCGAFNIKDLSTKAFIQGKIIYKLEHLDDSKTYLGTLGEAGAIVKHGISDTLKPICRSAMSPNVYQVSFRQIEPCNDSVNCDENICLIQKNKTGLAWDYEYSYKTISKKIRFLFMPLNPEPLEIIYNTETDRVRVK